MMLVCVAKTQAALGDPDAAEIMSKTRAAYEKVREYAGKIDAEQYALVKASLEELRSALE